MPAYTSSEPDDHEHRKLTAEEQEKLRRLASSIQRISVPKFNFNIPNIVDTSALTKVTADAAKLVSSVRSASAFNNLADLTEIAAHQSKQLDSLQPIFEMQSMWKEQFAFVNSDFFKTHTATQAEFANLGLHLTKTIDFGISDYFAKFAQQFAAHQSSWLKTLEPTLDRLRERLYPANLRDIEDLEFEEVEKVVMADAIALYGVPRTSIAEAVIRAASAAKRREILGRRWKAISADCREAIEGLSTGAVVPYIPAAQATLDALDNGHAAASQALTSSLIDCLLTDYFGKERYKYTPDKRGKRTSDAYEEFTVRQFVAFAPMWQVYQQFWVENGDRVPTTFSRNATAHTVSSRQFNRRNAVQALLFATGILIFVDEHAPKRS
ncbi:hypothetical protein GV791_27415 [Nocardia cyriacigeorgica]|uniref:Uncharacterized protein n=1 Tax=Nocardia cyriacigeorgica TaxID=135487 RepID=A0A6P1CWX4_9NOCA|nr:hypothetical protein [Nocardia cyriacigeorgica]MBF6426073.1 hypothetical protein [Nocardia cyriacigeorgica]NEW36262.1 hypothetical protein [Nocardia cyriacigeorgica]